MEWLKDKILPGLITAILLAMLGGIWKIYMVISVVPDKFEINDQQHEQFIKIMQNEQERRIELEKQVLILQTKLER